MGPSVGMGPSLRGAVAQGVSLRQIGDVYRFPENGENGDVPYLGW